MEEGRKSSIANHKEPFAGGLHAELTNAVVWSGVPVLEVESKEQVSNYQAVRGGEGNIRTYSKGFIQNFEF